MRTLSPQWTNRSLALDLFNQLDKFWEADYLASSKSNIYDERTHNPACEILEGEDHFFISVDLPGMKIADLKIEISNNLLTVSGERKRETAEKNQKFQHYEKAYGFFKRSFNLPAVQADKIEARYESGVLELYVPKIASAKPRQIQVQMEKSGFLEKILGSKKESGTAESDLKSIHSATES